MQNSARAAVLALLLLALGFLVGYGYHTAQSVPPPGAPPPAGPTKPPRAAPAPPTVKGLRVSPDGSRLAFSAIHDGQRRASRFVLDLKTRRWSVAATPDGWQDYIVQWSADSRKILFERERIPRPAGDATPGLYEAEAKNEAEAQTGTGDAARSVAAPPSPHSPTERLLTGNGALPANEKLVAGFWTPDGTLMVKTRREPKALYALRAGRAAPVDRAAVTYEQNRAVREGGKTVFYVVRDVPGQPRQTALFRVQNGVARRLSEPLSDIEWAYVSENARWMIVCREAGDGENWNWTLYRVTPRGAARVASRVVPGDVSQVYWSPDTKRILGTSAESLWLIDIPTLQTRRLGTRRDWNANDAAWLPQLRDARGANSVSNTSSGAVIVAAKGRLWQVGVPSGAAREIWKFPDLYWK